MGTTTDLGVQTSYIRRQMQSQWHSEARGVRVGYTVRRYIDTLDHKKAPNLNHNARTRGGWSTAVTVEELVNPLVNYREHTV